MLPRLFTIIGFVFFPVWAISQTCPSLVSPVEGETNVAVDETIFWQPVENVPSYQIRLGTAPGLDDLGFASVGNATSFTPPLGLPENTEVFVTIILDFLFGGNEDVVCSSKSFFTESVTTTPDCTQLRAPQNGSTEVSVFTNLTWNYAPRATGYSVTLGTTSGSGDIVNDLDVGNTLSFLPPGQLPPNTTIYVQITPYNTIGDATNCQEFTFETRDVAPLPGCTTLISPSNGSTNVPLTPLLEWISVPGATGYEVSIGTTPGSVDILDAARFFTNSTFVIDFESNRTFFITIVPFNESGLAVGCNQESFSTSLGCGPFFDPNSGEIVNFFPEIDFPSVFSFCENAASLLVEGPNGVDGYRWFSLDQFGNETLLSEDNTVNLTSNGLYRLEAFNLASPDGTTTECPVFFDFEVVPSELANIDNLRIQESPAGLQVTVEVSGIGDYEYAVDNPEGPYQDSNVFSGLSPGNHIFYVRDKNGCGIVQRDLDQGLTLEGFPKFFTPNGDTINDFWQFVQPLGGNPIVLQSIQIFDRFGTFLKQIDQNSAGWDGTFNGNPLPSGDYWFKAVDDENRMVQGHFALKR
nr:T9SS type B sorting domain-containing protein [Allomuricauda sp.]